jgi:hypothetical protein
MKKLFFLCCLLFGGTVKSSSSAPEKKAKFQSPESSDKKNSRSNYPRDNYDLRKELLRYRAKKIAQGFWEAEKKELEAQKHSQ